MADILVKFVHDIKVSSGQFQAIWFCRNAELPAVYLKNKKQRKTGTNQCFQNRHKVRSFLCICI